MSIEKIYKNLLEQCLYDETYAGNYQIIDGKIHGVCLDFSRILVRNFRKNGIKCGLISTLNDDGYLHAAVIYNDPITNEILIADPVTDVKMKNKLTIDRLIIKKNYCINLQDYYRQYGAITDYDDSEFEMTNKPLNPKVLRSNMTNFFEIISNPYVIQLKKRVEAIQNLISILDVEKVADTATLLACQLLYERGINTFCSNFDVETGYCDIAINYNSLSEENKIIFHELMKESPNNYKLFDKRKVFGYPQITSDGSICEDIYPIVACIGYDKNCNLSPEEINLKMAELINKFNKQIYMQGVYTRQDVINNKHNYMKLDLIHQELEKNNCDETNTNEEIAISEKLLYSKKFDLFFENESSLSRYIESIYRKENDLRSNEKIAKEYSLDYRDGMFSDSTIFGISESAITTEKKISFLLRIKELLSPKDTMEHSKDESAKRRY